MNTVAVIPMKLNNSRLPGKNTRTLSSGKPLCMYILQTMLKVHGINEIYVYCSDERICQYLPKGITYLKRSPTLDFDTTSINQVLACFAKEVHADVYVMSHATSPLVSAKSIQKGLDAVLSGTYDSAFAVKKLQDFFWRNHQPVNYQLDAIPRTQDIEPIYEETSGFYIYQKQVILDMNRRIGNHPYLVEVNEIESIDVDEEIDFYMADALISYQNKRGTI